MRAKYFWPTMEVHATSFVRKCKKCQVHANLHHLPTYELHSVSTPIPFFQWGMDNVGLFPKVAGNNEFLFVVVDYFTKWAEAKATPSIIMKKAQEFFWEHFITHFVILKVLITYNDKQFEAHEFQSRCVDLKIDHRFTAVGHPQMNGLAEVTNIIIKQGLNKLSDAYKTKLVEELPNVLCSYRTLQMHEHVKLLSIYVLGQKQLFQ